MYGRSGSGFLTSLSDLLGTRRPALGTIFPGVELSGHERMSYHTTFRVGGPVACMARPRTEDALAALLKATRERDVRCIVLGGGSNVLAPDEALDALILKLTLCSTGIHPCENAHRSSGRVYVGAGVRNAEFIRFCLRNGYDGMDFLVGIPGTIGGALVMNAGTREGCMADSLLWVELLDTEGRRQRMARSELSPLYRSMGFSKEWIVLGAGFQLRPSSNRSSRGRLAEIMKQRKNTQPLGWPSAGCIFKNPPGHSAGALIDKAGLKGFHIGDAAVSEKHANFIINRGKAGAREILALMRLIEERVREKFGIRLEREIQVL